MAGFSQYHVRLFRDSFDTPWGFRLQGGKDLHQPLTIQRVFTGSPAEGELQRGDIILSISERQADTLTHKQAQDLIKFGGGSISLTIQRPPPGRVNVAQPAPKPAVQAPTFRPQPKPMPQQKAGKIRNLGGHGPDFGADFTRSVPQYGSLSPSRSGTGRDMLSQVQHSFESRGFSGGYDPEGVITEPQYTPMKPHSRQFQSLISEDFSTPKYSEPTPVYHQSFTSSVQTYRTGQPDPDDDDYEVVPVAERRKAFMGDQPTRKWGNQIETPLHIARAPKPAPKPRSPLPPSSGPDFGLHYPASSKWTPMSQHHHPAAAPLSPQPTFMSPAVMSQSAYTPASGEIETPKVPAWSGSLRQTGVKQWEEDFSPSSYNPPQSQPKPRSVPKKPKQAPVRTAQPYNPAPRTIPIQTQGDEEGPRVVHLQYNSPMGLYSNENVQETLDGQTRAMASGKNPNMPPQNQDGSRDWSQSTLYRMIQQDEQRSGGGRPAHSSSTTTIETSYQQPVHAGAFQPGGGMDISASDF